ncbi:MAG: hypothetical protein ACOX6N_04880 [Patescibacteria group bacterium]|jgi:hypothetical protein
MINNINKQPHVNIVNPFVEPQTRTLRRDYKSPLMNSVQVSQAQRKVLKMNERAIYSEGKEQLKLLRERNGTFVNDAETSEKLKKTIELINDNKINMAGLADISDWKLKNSIINLEFNDKLREKEMKFLLQELTNHTNIITELEQNINEIEKYADTIKLSKTNNIVYTPLDSTAYVMPCVNGLKLTQKMESINHHQYIIDRDTTVNTTYDTQIRLYMENICVNDITLRADENNKWVLVSALDDMLYTDENGAQFSVTTSYTDNQNPFIISVIDDGSTPNVQYNTKLVIDDYMIVGTYMTTEQSTISAKLDEHIHTTDDIEAELAESITVSTEYTSNVNNLFAHVSQHGNNLAFSVDLFSIGFPSHQIIIKLNDKLINTYTLENVGESSPYTLTQTYENYIYNTLPFTMYILTFHDKICNIYVNLNKVIAGAHNISLSIKLLSEENVRDIYTITYNMSGGSCILTTVLQNKSNIDHRHDTINYPLNIETDETTNVSLNISTNHNDVWNNVLMLMAPNTTHTQNVNLLFGKKPDMKNSGYIGYRYNNVVDNRCLNFGLYGCDNLLQIYPNRIETILPVTASNLKADNETRLASVETGKANSTHNHTISDVEGLQTALDGKAGLNHSHSTFTLDGNDDYMAITRHNAPNIASGKNGCIMFGKSYNTNECAYVGYRHNDVSNDRCINFGLYNVANDLLQIYPNRIETTLPVIGKCTTGHDTIYSYQNFSIRNYMENDCIKLCTKSIDYMVLNLTINISTRSAENQSGYHLVIICKQNQTPYVYTPLSVSCIGYQFQGHLITDNINECICYKFDYVETTYSRAICITGISNCIIEKIIPSNDVTEITGIVDG